ncbi:short-chain fatty acid transporter [Fusibacter ferrireducens]|uniref:Short-chain fatty acid transporter n=1 Tax=Fusibacter ferrireducens TaxID=2785058 RepID=A0ABR9ZSB9_9FIRM|nr:TIGR00366 family protein [Fusibacter ferrireducens]MBF4693347.1 short-chain fatty acid transporter [Fusibacter ferrireducens]
MIKRLTSALVLMVKKYLPNPYILCSLLTLFVFLAGIIVTHKTPYEMTTFWGNGFFNLLKFTMQMILVLFTGHALANAPVVVKILKKLASVPKTRVQAVMFTCVIAYICSYLNWGFGLIAGVLIAKEIAVQHRGKGIHFPLIVAAAYSGNIARGPSTSIPLVIATKGHFLEDSIGIIPVSDSLYSSWNIIITITLMIAIPLLFKAMMPSVEDSVEVDLELFGKEENITAKKSSEMTPAERIENSSVLTWLIGILGLVYIGNYFVTKGFNLDLNIVIMIFMTLGILGHHTPINYVKAANEAIKVCGGIALQFPFYAGIMGMMKDSGLAIVMSEFFISIATQRTFPLFTFLSAGIVNIFIPSGGGQWAIQGPIMIPAAKALNVDIAKTAMALAWGDSWTNQIQPFWALPILAIAGLDVKDIMGYCAMVLILAGAILGGGFLLL